MTTLYVKKIDETTLKFACDDVGVHYELSDYFRFYAPGYKYDPRFRNHLWNGKIMLVSASKQTAPVGLRQQIQKFCTDRNYHFIDQTEEQLLEKGDDVSSFDQWLETINLPFEPRDYQKKAVLESLTGQRRTLLSPTGSGKSLIIYLILRWNLSKSRKCVVIVPSTSLVEQMVDDFKKYSINDDGWDAEKEVAKLYSKVNTDPFEVDALVTTWQSICRYDNSLYNTWDCIIVDEAHNAKSKILQQVVNGATNAKFKIGTTGSLTGENVHEFILTGSFGPVCQVATTKQLQDGGQLSDMDIHMLILKYPKEESKTLFREIGKDFNTEIDYINKHAKRQLFTRNLACSLKGTVMILFKLREQGETLYKLIKEKVGDSRPVFHIDGRVKASLREEIRQSINDNKGAILVASVGTSATGLNIPCIENVILCPSKSRVRNLQSIGRGLRLSEDKTICNVFDLVDDLSYGNHKNYSLKHGMERYNLYQSEGFKITFNEIKF